MAHRKIPHIQVLQFTLSSCKIHFIFYFLMVNKQTSKKLLNCKLMSLLLLTCQSPCSCRLQAISMHTKTQEVNIASYTRTQFTHFHSPSWKTPSCGHEFSMTYKSIDVNELCLWYDVIIESPSEVTCSHSIVIIFKNRLNQMNAKKHTQPPVILIQANIVSV